MRCWALAVVAIAVGGCWAEEDRIGGVFTADQLAHIRARFQPPDASVDPCAVSEGSVLQPCDQALLLGKELYVDQALSSTGKVSCKTCHDPEAWFVDARTGNATSLGAVGWTKRNSVSLVNMALKPPGTFTWLGKQTPFEVITTVAFPKAMGVSADNPAKVAATVRTTAQYQQLYAAVFGWPATDLEIFSNVARVLEAYLRQANSLQSPFDEFIAGDDHALPDDALKGFGVFVGRGNCFECHRDSLFSDEKFHVTGVPSADTGRNDTGEFYTATLRHIAKTGPYMHDGSLATLAEVVDFYRWGGGVSGYPKDPLIEPLPIDDQDAADLVAFLGQLTGVPVDASLSASCAKPTVTCAGACVDLATDAANCGACGMSCAPSGACINGACTLASNGMPTCTAPATTCAGACVDLQTDPASCGTCGHVCPSNKPSCVQGTCKP